MNYKYKSLSVPGGGFVTGFLFHPTTANLLYCRTDIGGVYRYDFNVQTWISLVDQIKDTEKWKTYPLSIALDKQHPERLYMAVGEHEHSAIGFSEDYGNHFIYLNTPQRADGTPVEIHGNAPGRSTGERLIIDPWDSNTLYLGTMFDGLFVTYDQCQTWSKLTVGDHDEHNIAFIDINIKAGSRNGRAKGLIVSVSGEKGSPDGVTRGKTIYISHDGGSSFAPLQDQPEPVIGGSMDHPGYVGQHIAFDDKYMYITYSAYNIGWSSWNSYGCDTGKCYDGAFYRYELNEEGQVIESLDLTPVHPMDPDFHDTEAPSRRLGHGLSGISTDPNNPGTLILTTITAHPDVFYRSTDYGKTFEPIMAGLEIGKILFHTSYHQPKFNGNDSLIHWMSDIAINPFYSDMALFTTGAGVYITKNLTAHNQGETVIFETFNTGIEETVHLNVYSPIAGRHRVIDVIGDYGMFLFKDSETIPDNTVADIEGNRWITAMNADFSDQDYGVLIATMRGNWTGHTKGGLILTEDDGQTFRKLPSPGPISKAIDKAVTRLANPNVTSGWVALSANSKNLVWAIGQPLDGDLVVFSHDYGLNYGKTAFTNKNGQNIHFKGAPVKVFSDRVIPWRFYGFADFQEGPKLFVSQDFGETFSEINGPKDFPKRRLAGIDAEQHMEIRGIPYEAGAFYLAMESDGLWKIIYDEDINQFVGKLQSQKGDIIKRIGIGIDNKGKLNRLYTSGTIQDEYGFFSSDDGGSQWTRLNDEDHQFGDIRSIDGDKHVPGKFYIATGTRGLICGEEV